MAATSKQKGDHSAALFALHALRTNSAYRDAEFMRRKKGSKAMVAKKDSQDYAAAVLLIGTWNTIGAAVRQAVESSSGSSNLPGAGDDYLDAIFESIPVCHMYRGLQDALEKLKQMWGEDYAPDFEWLYQEYLKWLERTGKDKKYRTRHCDGIRAFFG